jgi:hypothetical protein
VSGQMVYRGFLDVYDVSKGEYVNLDVDRFLS